MGGNHVKIEGYMPKDAQIKVEEVKADTVQDATKKYMNDKTTIKVAYDIKIISEEKEYEPTDFDENVKVTITGINTENTKYKVIHIDNENETEEMKQVETKEDSVSFKTNEFSTYALLAEEINAEEATVAEEGDIQTIAYESSSAIIQTESEWDGQEIATKFSYGSGTR